MPVYGVRSVAALHALATVMLYKCNLPALLQLQSQGVAHVKQGVVKSFRNHRIPIPGREFHIFTPSNFLVTYT